MKIDLTALKAKMLANAAAQAATTPTSSSEQVSQPTEPAPSSQTSSSGSGSFYSSQTALEIAGRLYDEAAKKVAPAPSPAGLEELDYLQQLDAQKLLEKIGELDSMLKEEHPGYASLLRDIHSTLTKQPDNVTLLSDEQIGVIVSAAVRQAGVQISAKATPASKKKGLAKISVADLASEL